VSENSIEQTEANIVAQSKAAIERGEPSNGTTLYTCPNCGGVLWELEEEGMLRYRCHVGHVFSEESFQNAQDDALELALWTAFRALEESASMARRMANHARDNGHALSAAKFEDRAHLHAARAAVLSDILGRERPELGADKGATEDVQTGGSVPFSPNPE
jgi:two-component system chemotaxis response regulator CheB